ncbi:hypothetical protein [Burkholderia sp. BCC1985]|uniref:hypothetical protein n=1 Tax=Burkholderia sp. BCC1985 TaxID=2817442 RepID=UPI002AAF701E|nr:hypothetical protein [Burkholderia sp. BCC1985]
MGSLMGGSGVFGGGGGSGRQRGGGNGGRAGQQHVSAARRGNGVVICGTHEDSLNVRCNGAALDLKGFGSARERRSRGQPARSRSRTGRHARARTNADRRLSRDRAARTEIVLNCRERGRRAARERTRQKN